MTTDPLPRATGSQHLTDALRRSGTLVDGRVRGVVVESSRTTELSRIIRLRLTYEPAAADAPSSLILKTARPDRVGGGWIGGRHEVGFYDQVAPAMSAVVAPRCFEAFWDAETHDWHLLLEDLSDSHVIATAWPLPPRWSNAGASWRGTRASMRRGGTIPAWARPWEPGPTPRRRRNTCGRSPSGSRGLPTSWATACRASDGTCSSACSTRPPPPRALSLAS